MRDKLILCLALVLSGILLGCADSWDSHISTTIDPPDPVLHALDGKRVELVGLASSQPGSEATLTSIENYPTRSELKIDGLKKWPADVAHHCIKVTGVLTERYETSAQLCEPVLPGTPTELVRKTPAYFVRKAKWELIPDQKASSLKRAFSEACGGKSQILDDAVLPATTRYESNRTFWVIRAKPSEAGFYTLTDNCEKTELYGTFNRCRHVYHFKIAPAGTSRTVNYYDSKPTACLGDRIILVIEISSRLGEHKFKLEFSGPKEEESLRATAVRMLRENHGPTLSEFSEHELAQVEYDMDEIRTTNAPPGAEPSFSVINPLNEYLNSTRIRIARWQNHAGMGNSYLEMSFMARQPTNLNLRISVTPPRIDPRSTRPSFWESANGTNDLINAVPVVIVPGKTKLDVFLKTVHVDWYSTDNTSSHDLWTDLLAEATPCVLRVGDSLETTSGGGAVDGIWDSSTRIKCDAEPFAYPAPDAHQVFGEISPLNIYRRIKWRNYPANGSDKGL